MTTVQRWEKREGMPVHRHVHDKMGSVYAFRSDLDAWARSRNLALVAEDVQRATRPAEESLPAAEDGIVGDVESALPSRYTAPQLRWLRLHRRNRAARRAMVVGCDRSRSRRGADDLADSIIAAQSARIH